MNYFLKCTQIFILLSLLITSASAQDQQGNVIPETFLRILQQVPEHPVFLVDAEAYDVDCRRNCVVELVIDHNTELLNKSNKPIDIKSLTINKEYRIDFFITENINSDRVKKIKLSAE